MCFFFFAETNGGLDMRHPDMLLFFLHSKFGIRNLDCFCMVSKFFFLHIFYSSSNIKKIGSLPNMLVLILKLKGIFDFWLQSRKRYFSYSLTSKFEIFLKQFWMKFFCLLPIKRDLFRFEIRVTSAPNW